MGIKLYLQLHAKLLGNHMRQPMKVTVMSQPITALDRHTFAEKAKVFSPSCCPQN